MPGQPQKSRVLSFRQGLFSGLAGFILTLSFPAIGASETLEEALISAYQNHAGLQAERARLRELDETYVQARAQGRMTSSIGGTASINASRTPALDIPLPGFDSFIDSGTTFSTPIAAEARFIQPIYQGGRVSALKSQAMAGIYAAREGLRAQETQILTDVATTYIDILRDEEAARIRRSNVQVLLRQKEAADSRFEVGAGTRTDMAQADARLAGAKVGLAQAEAELQVSRANFKRLTGHMPEALTSPPSFQLPASEKEAIELALANNPQILAALYSEEAGEAGIKAAKAAYKPTIALTGSLQAIRGQAGFPDRAETAMVGAQISVPLTTGGMNRSRIRAAESARTRLMFETRDTQAAIEAAIMQSWAGLQAAKSALDASEVQVAAAKLAFEGVELEREVGRRTALDVLNAEQELLEAQLTVLNSRSEVAKAGYRLLAITGGFDAYSLSLPTEYYQPEDNFDDVSTDDYLGIVEEILPDNWR